MSETGDGHADGAGQWTNTITMTEEQREKARERIMERWRNGEPIIQPDTGGEEVDS